ncbi:hypothetical protein CRH09_17980 [Nocardia terpenica]|uniref:Uncharacterized protein n=1 Tax=Nocardia terpenica TaxID=455432 RepID=A0A291RL25_9NOCA|nr:hypothetical protein CRH09_17980 [Nocardia terpenica]
MFVGRTDQLGVIDALIGPPAAGGFERPRPVFVVAGCGGSGRTELLREVRRKWHHRTHLALISPRDYPPDDGPDAHSRHPIRPLLTAIMLRLGDRIPGYRLTRTRILVAHIALKVDFSALAPDDQVERLRTEIDKHCDPRTLRTFVDDLAQRLGELTTGLNLPLGWAYAPRLVNTAGALLVWAVRARLRRRYRRAVEWFGDRDLNLNQDADRALINLSIHARRLDPDIQRGVDDMLTAALLADLRDSVARMPKHTPNIALLIDDGDSPTAAAFTGSLLRVRQLIADAGGPTADPVTLITTSSGFLTGTLARATAPADWSDAAPREQPGRITRPWIRAPLGGLSVSEVKLLAERSDPYRAEAVAGTVHRLTDGHPEATEQCLRRIGRHPELASDIDGLLRGTEPELDGTLEQHLLRVFARGLSRNHRDHEELRQALVTVSAARTLGEARLLMSLLPDVSSPEAPVFTSESLWSGPTPQTRRLHPLARYLGRRALAARADPEASWERVCRRLRDAADPDDRATRLHYERLLHNHVQVLGDLARELLETPSERWLSLFDEIVSSVDPCQPGVEEIRGEHPAESVEGHLAVLLGAVPVFELDPCLTDVDRRQELCLLIGHSYLYLAGKAVGRAPLLLRANHYFALAQRFL